MGTYKKSEIDELYHQLDRVVSSDVMVEAKYYTKRGGKVGLSEVQEMQGAMSDLPKISKGIFTSATSFTKPAEQYSQGTSTNPIQKEIIPVNIKPSSNDDLKGRVQTIIINIHISEEDYKHGNFTPSFIEDRLEVGLVHISVEHLGKHILT
jgi:hypothetical protein